MRILHLTTHLNRGGISQYIISVGSAFRKKGHEIFVASSGGEMEQEFKAEGLCLQTLDIRTKSELNPKIYWALSELIPWMKSQRIEIMHAHTRVTQVMAFWIQRLSGIPFITTVHGFYKRRFGRRILPAWGERAVAISEPVGNHLRETFHLSLDRIRVIYNGVDFADFIDRFRSYDPREVRREYGISEKAPVVGVTARLVPDKGHEYLIRAVKRLESEFPDLSLLIVGDGRYREHLKGLAQELNLLERIYFTGNLRDVSKPLAAVNVFALPAVWREGFGLSIVEAMICQKPVIVTNIWALNTLIQNGVNGILVEPRHVEDLARAIRLFLKDPDLRERISRAGQATAHERFSLERMVEELETVYRKVLPG